MPSKGLQMQIVGADGETVISVVRNVSIMLLRVNSIQNISSRLTLADLANYTPDYELNGGGLACSEPLDETMWEHIYPGLLEYAPLAVPAFFDTTGLAEYRVKLVAASGYYALSQRYTSPITSPTFALFRDDGTQIGSSSFTTGRIMGSFNNVNTGTTRAFQVVLDGDNIVALGSIITSYGWQLPGNGITVSTIYNSTERANIIEWLNGITSEYPETPDPYEQGGFSGTGGGTGDFDGSSDVIDFPPLPSLSSTDTGFIELFNPSALQLKSLANYMWAGAFDVDAWKKIFANPMDAILGLSIVPVAIPAGGAGAVTVGNISTGISMTRAASQYVEVDCGTLNVNEFWGAYLDYDPYTKAEIYLPYVGTHPLAVDDIMGKPVHVKYHVDILSGACCAYVMCGTAVLYSWTGQCSCSVPITGNDWTNVVNGAISIASSIGSMIATGGLSAPMAMTSIASTAVNSIKPSVEKSGAMGSMGGMLGIQRPYIILTRPRQAVPENQKKFTGYPSFITMKLGDCAGYTEVENIHIENIPATDAELSEIDTLLKGGVII